MRGRTIDVVCGTACLHAVSASSLQTELCHHPRGNTQRTSSHVSCSLAPTSEYIDRRGGGRGLSECVCPKDQEGEKEGATQIDLEGGK